MRAEKVVAALLNGDAGIAAIVGTRIYGAVAPEEDPAPLLIYSKADGTERLPDLDTAETTVRARVDVLVVATTYVQLKELAEAVRVALEGQSGSVAGVALLDIEIDAEGGDQYEPNLREFAQVWTFRVVHTEQ